MGFLMRISIAPVLVAGAIDMKDYGTLRWAIFIMTLILILIDKVEKQVPPNVIWGNIAVVVLFNPVVPIYLYNRPVWIVLDILAAFFILRPIFLKDKNERSIEEQYRSLPNDRSRREFIMSRNADDLVYDPDEDEILQEILKDYNDEKSEPNSENIQIDEIIQPRKKIGTSENIETVETGHSNDFKFEVEIIQNDDHIHSNIKDSVKQILTHNGGIGWIRDDGSCIQCGELMAPAGIYPKAWLLKDAATKKIIGIGWLSNPKCNGKYELMLYLLKKYKNVSFESYIDQLLQTVENEAQRIGKTELTVYLPKPTHRTHGDPTDAIPYLFDRGFRSSGYFTKKGMRGPIIDLTPDQILERVKSDGIYMYKYFNKIDEDAGILQNH